jgi:RNA polymerase sigma factor (sigma-70 family)
MSKTDGTDLTLLLPHAAWARRLARVLVSASEAEDLCQEAWLKTLESPSLPREPKPWLATVLRRIGRNRFRSTDRRRVRELGIDLPEAVPSPEQSLGRMEIQRMLAERVAALEEPFRQTLLLRYFDDLSGAEIARRLDVPAGTVRWRLSTALERLRADLDLSRPEWRRDWALIVLPTGTLAPAALLPPAAAPAASASSAGIATFPILVAALVTLGAITAALGWHTLSTLPATLLEPPRHALLTQVPLAQVPGTSQPPGLAVARQVPGTSLATEGAPLDLPEAERGEGIAPITAERFPIALVQAFVASQDRRFFEHEGVDLQAMARALFVNLRAGGIEQGGTGITQQLAKLSLGAERTLARKLRQVAIAHELERRFTKREILALYFERIFLGHGAFGVEAAARRYFDKEVSQLDIGECALLAGIAHAPARNSPIEHPEAARARRNGVLDQMVESGALTRAQADQWASLPLRLR